MEALRQAFESFRANKLRSSLSLIGIIIGVASVVAITSIAASGTASLRKEFSAFRTETIEVYPEWKDDGSAPKIAFDEQLVRALLSGVPGIKTALPLCTFGAELRAGRKAFPGRVHAVGAPYFDAFDAAIAVGNPFSDIDEYTKKAGLVLGDRAAATLFPEGDPVGKEVAVALGDSIFRLAVLGVLAPKDQSMGTNWNQAAFVTYSWARSRVSANLQPESLTILARDNGRLVELGDEIEAFFRERTGDPRAVNVFAPAKWAEADDKMTRSITAILVGIAAISLVVGGIGIMNTMLVSVTERKREIGIRKAVGATERAIRAQFLAESCILTLAGGVFGLLAGYGIAAVAVKLIGWDFVATADTALLAFGVSAGVGLFFGLYPAARAARLDPVEALAAD